MDMFGITGLIPLSWPSDSNYGGGNGRRGRRGRGKKGRTAKSECERMWEFYILFYSLLSLPVVYMFATT